MNNKHKSQKVEQILLKQQADQLIDEVLRFSKKRFKKFDEVIDLLHSNVDLSRFYNTDKRIRKLSECFKEIAREKRSLFKEVLKYLNNNSILITGEESIHAVYNMVTFRKYWRNNIFQWKPSSKQDSIQVHELATWLFCQYPVPGFLFKAFYETNQLIAIDWFIHIGSGKRVKDMPKVPFRFTQKMGHYFLQAPSKFSIQEALRWAQVRGLGGDEKLADRIAYSWLATKAYSNEDFWEAFLMILAIGGMFNLAKVGELIDYVREAKRINDDYSLKGRTLSSLMKQSDEWHKQYTHHKGSMIWKPCGLDGFKFEKKNEVIVIEELTAQKALIAEGKTMRHCVASYFTYCSKGKSAIFSFRKYSMGILMDTLATIEVNLSLNRIIQAKGKMNRPVSEEVKRYMEMWANSQQLEISPYL